MKVVIGTDLEGVAGVVSFEQQAFADGKYYEAAKKLTTAEINAAVEALVAAGVEDILVEDGHGVGGIVFEDLHPAAKLLHGRRPQYRGGLIDEAMQGYDTFMMIGQHAMAGVQTATLNHTQNSRSIDYLKLNGQPVGETAQLALYHGALGMPLIFLSGEEAACREVEAMIHGITTVAVKKGLSRGSAISLSAQAARQKIREGVAAAVCKQQESPLPPYVVPGPYMMEIRFFHTDSADACVYGHRQRLNVERVDDQTVRLYADDVREVIFPL